MRKQTPENIKYKNKYNSDNYDRISLMVPKGQKQAISRRAQEKGCKSTNTYLSGLVQADLGLTDDEWKNPKTDQ